jgi:hypothetical protein
MFEPVSGEYLRPTTKHWGAINDFDGIAFGSES